jgi:hypothetical protein
MYTRIQYINLLDKSWVTKHHKWYHRFSKTKLFYKYFRGFLERENMPFWYNKIGDVLVKNGGVFLPV